MSTRRHWINSALILPLLLANRSAMAADKVKTDIISKGIAARMSSLRPHQIDLLEGKPDSITKLPNGLDSPVFGTITMGPREAPMQFTVLMDMAAKGAPHVWIDANANGDLTDDSPILWEHEDYKSFDGSNLRLYRGTVELKVRYGNHVTPLRLSIVRYDPNDPNRAAYKNSLLVTADYARAADVTIGNNKYHVMFYDYTMNGDFRGQKEQPISGVAFMIDVNQNGQFDARGESYDAWRPFNIKGTTYEIANMTPDGTEFEVIPSKQKVAEIPPPPDLRVGKIAPAFTQKLMGNQDKKEGKTVRFPGDFKGHPVLLYFWGAYCGDCQKEMKTVQKVYNELHPKGLEMLGVSVDPDKADAKVYLPNYYRQEKMNWPQIFEGKFWLGSTVQLYFVQNVPAPFLIDGTTGKILASGNDLMGANLAPTIKKHLINYPSNQTVNNTRASASTKRATK